MSSYRNPRCLGHADQADTVEIRWPLGLREVYKNVKANQILMFKEGAAPSG